MSFRIKVQVSIFDEQYRVIATESQRLAIRGVMSGKVLVINTDPACPIMKNPAA